MTILKYTIIALFLLSCSENPKQKEFSYEDAIRELQNEILKMEDGEMKHSLLWKIERILKKDTLFKHKLDLNTYDSLKHFIVWDEYMKFPKRQLNLDNLELLTIADRMEVYKFKYTRAFSDDIIELCISKQEVGKVTIMWKIFSRDRNCNPFVGVKSIDGSCFTVKLNEAKHLQNKNWNTFISLIDSTNFWNLPPEINNEGLDGSGWTIEGSKTIRDSSGNSKQIYKSVYRWSPDSKDPIYKIGKRLLETHEYDWGEIY